MESQDYQRPTLGPEGAHVLVVIEAGVREHMAGLVRVMRLPKNIF